MWIFFKNMWIFFVGREKERNINLDEEKKIEEKKIQGKRKGKKSQKVKWIMGTEKERKTLFVFTIILEWMFNIWFSLVYPDLLTIFATITVFAFPPRESTVKFKKTNRANEVSISNWVSVLKTHVLLPWRRRVSLESLYGMWLVLLSTCKKIFINTQKKQLLVLF